MTSKQVDVISGKAQLSTGKVEAVLDLKKHLLTVRMDTNGDGLIDTEIKGQPTSRTQTDVLIGLLYDNAVKLAKAHDGPFSEKDVRLIGIDARGIITNRENTR